MDFSRRLKLFLIGVVFGSIVMYFYVLKDRNIYKSPQDVIKEKLSHNKIKYNTKVACILACSKMDTINLRVIMAGTTAVYTNTKEKDCPVYLLNLSPYFHGMKSIKFSMCESTNTILSIDTERKCDCDSLK